MNWEINYSSLEEIMPLKGNTITVTYANKPQAGGLDKPLRVCQAMQAARKGHAINLDENNQACYGGDYWCGFIPEPRPGHEEHLTNKEHIYVSLAVAKRSISGGPPLPTAVAKYMLLSPLEKTAYEPDLVLFFCLPIHAAKLLGLTTYNTGAPRQVYATGATCRGAISIPLMTGEPQISFIDVAARRRYGYKPEELIVTLPHAWFLEVLRNNQAKKKFPPYNPLTDSFTPDSKEIKLEDL